jgi:hypothetical protein
MAHTGTRILVAMACAACFACGDQAPKPPTPGMVDVMLTTPSDQDRAVLVTLVGEIQTFTPAGGITHFENRSGTSVTLLLVAGTALAQGENRLGSFGVPDTTRIGSITGSITEVARVDYSLSSDVTAYGLRLARQ